ncbi:hypothetical protein ACI8AC_12250 [Geodermatophilus sp. SYSU D00758]
MAGSDHVAGRDQETGRAHAVPRDIADGPAPWLGVCGVPVGVVRGAWAGPRGLGSAHPCPDCRRIAAG